MRKRGQLISETLVYVLVIVIFGTVLMMGYKYIGSAKETIDRSSVLQLQSRISSDISVISKDYGAFKKVSYEVPENVQEVCFVDHAKKSQLLSSKLITFYPIILDSVRDDANKNVFFIGNAEHVSTYVPNFEISHYPYMNCFQPSSGKIQVGIEGLGSSALVLADFVSKARVDGSNAAHLESADSVIQMDIPKGTEANSLGIPVSEITVEMIDINEDSESRASDVYKFSPSGTVFSNPVELKIKYNPAVFGEACPPSAKIPYFYQFNDDGTIKAKKSPTRYECGDRIAVFEIDGFSYGYISAESQPTQGTCARQCSGSTPYCNPLGTTCVECLQSAHCNTDGGDRKVCDAFFRCTDNPVYIQDCYVTKCGATGYFCHYEDHKCYKLACTASSDCPRKWDCRGNECQQVCNDDCQLDEKRCNGESISQACGNYDGDSCYEWPATTNGAGNTVCAAGTKCTDKECTQSASQPSRPVETNPVATCGDGTSNQQSEECDRADVKGMNCTSPAFSNQFIDGTLSCTSACKLDTSRCVRQSSAECKLTRAYWDKSEVFENGESKLIVEGENCDNKLVTFDVKEDDLAGDDPIKINPANVVFGGAQATSIWKAEWQDDGIGDPEFYFTALVDGKDIGSSNLLTVKRDTEQNQVWKKMTVHGVVFNSASALLSGVKVYESTTNEDYFMGETSASGGIQFQQSWVDRLNNNYGSDFKNCQLQIGNLYRMVKCDVRAKASAEEYVFNVKYVKDTNSVTALKKGAEFADTYFLIMDNNMPQTSAATCGDGTSNQQSEECDRADVKGMNCTSPAFSNQFIDGTLSCTSACKLDTSRCVRQSSAECGELNQNCCSALVRQKCSNGLECGSDNKCKACSNPTGDPCGGVTCCSTAPYCRGGGAFTCIECRTSSDCMDPERPICNNGRRCVRDPRTIQNCYETSGTMGCGSTPFFCHWADHKCYPLKCENNLDCPGPVPTAIYDGLADPKGYYCDPVFKECISCPYNPLSQPTDYAKVCGRE